MVDPNGNAPLCVPADHTWSYEYDDEDRVRFAHAPAPEAGGTELTTEFSYDDVGNRTVVIDANSQVTVYVYDERDSLEEVRQSPSVWTNPASPPSDVIVTAYEYDNLGNLARVVRASGDSTYERATNYIYDGLNRLVSETQYPAWPTTTPTLVTSFGYEPNGNRKSQENPLGQTTTYGYDAMSRLTDIDYSDAGTPDVGYGYDANGNRLEMDDGTGTTVYDYDELDRLLSVVSPGPVAVGYRYDLDGNRVKLIYPDSTAVNYVFDEASRLERLVDWANRVTSYAYRPDGRVLTAVMPNQMATQYLYDNALRLTRVWNQGVGSILAGQLGTPQAELAELELGVGAGVQGTTISRHTYTLDNVGNRIQVDEALSALGPPEPIGSMFTTTYDYDRLYRLTEAADPDVTTTYTYDPLGNRLSMVRDAVTTSYTYDRADRILTAGSVSYTVNANGNTTARGSDSLGYDQANRLKSATIASAASTYTYDGDGKRPRKIVASVTTTYVYDVNRGLPVVLDDGTHKYVWGQGLAFAIDTSGGAIFIYHADGLGSVRAIADELGSIVETYQTDEFGVPITVAGSVTQPFEYTGEQRDGETGFINLRARMYEPEVGRLLQRDPLAANLFSPFGIHCYVYASSNPTTQADPSGLTSLQLCYNAYPLSFQPAHAFLVLKGDQPGQELLIEATQSDDRLLIGRAVSPSSVSHYGPGISNCQPVELPTNADYERKAMILKDFCATLNQQELPYPQNLGLGRNSNSFAHAALLQVSALDPVTGMPKDVEPRQNLPGWDLWNQIAQMGPFQTRSAANQTCRTS